MLFLGGLFARKWGAFPRHFNVSKAVLNCHSQPISWSTGQALPTQNPHSWTNLSSVLWVEQPVGTGFSQGVPNITVRASIVLIIFDRNDNLFLQNEDELAAQLVGFMAQWLEVFPEMKTKNLYLTGESVSFQ